MNDVILWTTFLILSYDSDSECLKSGWGKLKKS